MKKTRKYIHGYVSSAQAERGQHTLAGRQIYTICVGVLPGYE